VIERLELEGILQKLKGAGNTSDTALTRSRGAPEIQQKEMKRRKGRASAFCAINPDQYTCETLLTLFPRHWGMYVTTDESTDRTIDMGGEHMSGLFEQSLLFREVHRLRALMDAEELADVENILVFGAGVRLPRARPLKNGL
jgi:hypothetical protein